MAVVSVFVNFTLLYEVSRVRPLLEAVGQRARTRPVAGLLAVVAHFLAVVGRGKDEDAICAAEGPVVPVVDGPLGLLWVAVENERDGAVAPLLKIELFDLAVLGKGLSDALLFGVCSYSADVDAG